MTAYAETVSGSDRRYGAPISMIQDLVLVSVAFSLTLTQSPLSLDVFSLWRADLLGAIVLTASFRGLQHGLALGSTPDFFTILKGCAASRGGPVYLASLARQSYRALHTPILLFGHLHRSRRRILAVIES
ncbi:hypothetical protein [Mesorhizobium sp.]|uniref:hypothetical protein n=1 Tax=Mesorhizobium sp. TaxID=1871066 RepID=UPI000FE4C3B4|nr:hypothetical protein [Mesorhizobium sp.]RWE78177.1 MAG: hypothetical protein EOS42_06050 [Mesorhizobium sp.]